MTHTMISALWYTKENFALDLKVCFVRRHMQSSPDVTMQLDHGGESSRRSEGIEVDDGAGSFAVSGYCSFRAW